MFNKLLLAVALAIAPAVMSQDASAQCCSSPVGYAAYSAPTAVVYRAPVAPVVYSAPVAAYRPYVAPVAAYRPYVAPVAAYRPYVAPVRYGVAYRGYGSRPYYGYRPSYGYGYGYRSYYRPYGGVSISIGY